MQVVPLQAIPSQSIKCVLAGQNCQILVYQKDQGLFFSLNSNGSDIVDSIICENANPLVCLQYLGFRGNFIFIDTQGTTDPIYTGFGTRYYLCYLTVDENVALGNEA